MSNILNTTAAIIVLCLTTIGSAQAHAANYHDYHAWSRPHDAVLGNSRSGYAGPVSSHGYYYGRPVHDNYKGGTR